MNETEHKQALQLGYQLNDYRLLAVLGVGGFGVTYLAEHATLGHKVAIKEYLPNEFALREGTTVHPKSGADRDDFEWGLTRFLDEARTLTGFRHPNLLRLSHYFEANNTAYIVMDYEEGEPLDALLARSGTLSEAELKQVLLPIVEGLRQVHAAGFLHRDIKPSNIYVRHADGSPVLLDFGAARQALGRKSKSMTAVVSAGYSPPEQYESGGEQGTWTDIYALSALCYRAMTGQTPLEAPRRLMQLARGAADPLPSLAALVGDRYSTPLIDAVEWGLRVIETERPQSLDDWVARLEGREVVEPSMAAAPGTHSPRSSAQSGGAGRKGASIGTAGQSEDARRGDFGGKTGWLVGIAAAAVALVGAALYLDLIPWPPFGEGSAGMEGARVAQHETPSTLSESTGQGKASETGARQREVSSEAGSPVGDGTAWLVVETEPAGAEVLIGSTVVGRTPLELRDVRAGAYDVTLRHPDYDSVQLEDQTFSDGEVLRIRRELVRGTGKLTVLLEPREAWIERDGRRLTESTPVTLEGLPSGLVTLTLGADEYRPVDVEVVIPKDGVGTLERTLVRIPYGSLTLELIPADAQVTLPDITPPYRAGIRLPEGSHRVAVTRTGYQSVTREVVIAGETRERVELEGKVGETFRDCPQCPELVVVPAGSFLMGAPASEAESEDDERPVHRVSIPKPLAVGKYEITFAEWDACVSGGGCGGYRPEDAGWGRGRRPVMNVSWDDAQGYVQWLSKKTGKQYRLLSEAEWEYVARAGSTGPFHTGGTISTSQANYGGWYTYPDTGWHENGLYREQTLPVGSFGSNGFGLHDVHGNVREWVQDCYNENYHGAPSDGSAWESGNYSFRVLRGGSWYDRPRDLRSANRDWYFTSGFLSNSYGFRILRTLTP